MGHPAQAAVWPHPRMGTARLIRLNAGPDVLFEGGADPRGEGLALGTKLGGAGGYRCNF